MKLRARVTTAIMTVLLSSSLVALTPGHAPAALSCTLYAPSKIVVSSPYRLVSWRYGADCAGAELASWWAYHPTQGAEVWAWYPHTTGNLYTYDTRDLGRWTWRGDGAWDANANDLRQNTAYTDVRLGSKGYLKVSRRGSTVTIWTRDSRYFPDDEKWNFYGGWHGVIQWRYVGYQTWHNLRSATLDRYGTYSISYKNSMRRDYRVVFPDNSMVWGNTTPVVRG